jgi:rod shape-determining protein MreC
VRNLIVFFYRNANMFLFIILQSFCLYLLFQNNSFHKASFISSSNHFVGNIFTTVNNINEYFHLKETNQKLAEENARLHNINKDAFAFFNKHEYQVNDSVYHLQYKYVTAKIVNNSVNKRNNYLTLDIGSNLGITPEMAVITSDGIVGITKEVSPNYTSVLSVLNKDARISAKIKKSNEYGSLMWEGGDYRYATLIDIPTHVKLKKGDTITTNSYSAIFPDNIVIGTIDKVYSKPGDNFYTLTVKFTTNLKNITHVYVVKNLLKDEQKKLEEETQKNQNDN